MPRIACYRNRRCEIPCYKMARSARCKQDCGFKAGPSTCGDTSVAVLHIPLAGSLSYISQENVAANFTRPVFVAARRAIRGWRCGVCVVLRPRICERGDCAGALFWCVGVDVSGVPPTLETVRHPLRAGAPPSKHELGGAPVWRGYSAGMISAGSTSTAFGRQPVLSRGVSISRRPRWSGRQTS